MSKMTGLILTVIFIIFPNELKNGINIGLRNTFTLLIPSVFPYMVISSLFLYTGALETISEFIFHPINKITGISKNACGAYILSLFCGYPTGARLATQLYEENAISEKEMKKLFFFGTVPGFGFCVSFLGGIYKNGLKIYLSYILASLIMFIILKEKKHLPFNEVKLPEYKFGESLIKSIKSSSASILEIAGFVCFFSCFCEIIKNIAPTKMMSAIFGIFLEITTGNTLIQTVFPNDIAKYISVFMTAFGGMCVIFQSMSFSKGKVSIIYFMMARVIFAIFSLVFYILFLNIGR